MVSELLEYDVAATLDRELSEKLNRFAGCSGPDVPFWHLKGFISHWCLRNPKCFTCWFRSKHRSTPSEVFLQVSRIQNTGCELGENGRTRERYRGNHRTPWVAGAVEVGVFVVDGQL